MPKVEPKVTAATSGASVAAAVCWVLHVVTHGALPAPVEGLVDVVVPGATALLGGYFARHQDRPSAPVNIAIQGSSFDSASFVKQVLAGRQYIRDTYGAPTGPAATPDPAPPAVAVQHTENPTPEGNTNMSLLTQFEALAEDLRGKVIGKVGAEVADDIHAAFDVFRGQGAQLLTQLGHDAQADAGQVAADVSQVASDAASVVTPAPVEAPAAPVEATPVTDPAVPAPAVPVDPSTPAA